jgi:two-component system, response regulator PdtaR
MHALIIEDEFLAAALLQDMLAEMGFDSFDVAATEDEAVKAARAHCPDFISADIRLRKGTGIAAVEAICRDQQIPVVFVTANEADLRERRDALVVAKPVHRSDLKRAVRQAMRQSG